MRSYQLPRGLPCPQGGNHEATTIVESKSFGEASSPGSYTHRAAERFPSSSPLNFSQGDLTWPAKFRAKMINRSHLQKCSNMACHCAEGSTLHRCRATLIDDSNLEHLRHSNPQKHKQLRANRCKHHLLSCPNNFQQHF